MKKIISIYPAIIFSLIFGFGWRSDVQKPPNYQDTQLVNQSIQTTEIIPLDVVQEMIRLINKERAITDLKRLTGVEPICTHTGCHIILNRQTGSEGLQWAKEYVYEELIRLNYSVEVQNWTREGYTDQNLIVRKQGMIYPSEEIYFVAHMDGVLYSGEEHYPAADDNASGAVNLLELARILSSRFLSRTAVLIFSTGEEHGALGARSYVDQLTPEELSAIQYVVDIDMIGYDSNGDGAMQLWSGDQPMDFVQLLSEIINSYQIGLIPQIVTGCA